eukprot:4459748-Alexandrium_andersonii.AAC.1
MLHEVDVAGRDAQGLCLRDKVGVCQPPPVMGPLSGFARSIYGHNLEAALLVPCREDADVAWNRWAP